MAGLLKSCNNDKSRMGYRVSHLLKSHVNMPETKSQRRTTNDPSFALEASPADADQSADSDAVPALVAETAGRGSATPKPVTTFSQAADSIPAAIVICRADGQLIDANLVALQATGLSREELLGRKIWECPRWNDRPWMQQELKQAIARAAEGITSQIDGLSGMVARPPAEVQITIAPVRCEDGSGEMHIVATAVDITDRVKAELRASELRNELVHISRLGTLGQMATSIAHELNQPLAAIATYAFAAREELRAVADERSQPLQETLEKIEQQALRAGEVIRRLRRLVTKSSQIRSTVDVAELVNEVLQFIGPDIRLARLTCRVEVAGTPQPVIADRVEIQQVLINLVRNSIEAIRTLPEDRRVIRITVDGLDDTKVQLRVRDFGPGVPEELRPQIFVPFVTTKQEGLGVGLAISQEIIRSHGGSIEFILPDGHGAEFRISLPTIRA